MPLTGRMEVEGMAPAFAVLVELWGNFVDSLGPQEPFCMSGREGEEMLKSNIRLRRAFTFNRNALEKDLH